MTRKQIFTLLKIFRNRPWATASAVRTLVNEVAIKEEDQPTQTEIEAGTSENPYVWSPQQVRSAVEAHRGLGDAGGATEDTLSQVLSELETKAEQATLAELLTKHKDSTTVTGNISAANQYVEADIEDQATAIISFNGTFTVSLLNFQLWDGHHWNVASAWRSSTSSAAVNTGNISTGAGGFWRLSVIGAKKIRVTAQYVTTGTVGVKIDLSHTPGINAVTTEGPVTSYQGGAWYTYATPQRYPAYITPLAANAVYTSAWIDMISFQRFGIFVLTDQAGSLQIQYSENASTAYNAQAAVAISASTPTNTILPTQLRWARVVYTNGATAQGSFFIQHTNYPI